MAINIPFRYFTIHCLYQLCYEYVSALHNVTNGCPTLHPRDITSHPGDERHAVRCCNNIGTTCKSLSPCQLASTYREAQELCGEQGMRICARNEKLNFGKQGNEHLGICCQTGCNQDHLTMWIADDVTGKLYMILGNE